MTYATEKTLASLNDKFGSGTTAGSSFAASATGGASYFKFASNTLTNAAQTIKASAGTLYGIAGFFDNATKAYLQFYDTASAVTVGTTVADFVFPLPPYWYDKGCLIVPVAFSAAIKVALTTTATGNTAVTGTALEGFAIFK